MQIITFDVVFEWEADRIYKQLEKQDVVNIRYYRTKKPWKSMLTA